jgi:hypothetical protein
VSTFALSDSWPNEVEMKRKRKAAAWYYAMTDACLWIERLKPSGHYGRVVKATDSNFLNICFPLGAQVQILLVSTFLSFFLVALNCFSHQSVIWVILLFYRNPYSGRTRGRGEPQLDWRLLL